MILIQKKNPPDSLIRYTKNRPNLNINWTNFTNNNYKIKEDIRKSLLEEQGYICAYCMRELKDDCKIEHYKTRHNYPNLIYDYNNMFAVDLDSLKYKNCCEMAKGSKDLTLDPKSSEFIDTLSYFDNGEIHSSVEQYETEINTVLNLNDEKLKNLRYNLLKNFIATYGKDMATKKGRNDLLIKLQTKDNNGKYLAMVGIYIWYLSKVS